ncbi:hypothetical protein NPIL_11601 [Nephila pilipes]|uniref:Uncharacterized protein n=1 Tax=Nephila pilipes TaxID=299642 RepID=A0A8X6UHG5_NEPPI|nr:hypothetical protein NPIL_11601 [Nephila pilipes]
MEFFLQNWDKAYFSALYFLQNNGLAENYAETVEKDLRSMISEREILHYKLNNFFFRFRISPDTVIVEIPGKILFNIHLRPRLDLIFPDICLRMKRKQDEVRRRNVEIHAFFASFALEIEEYVGITIYGLESSGCIDGDENAPIEFLDNFIYLLDAGYDYVSESSDIDVAKIEQSPLGKQMSMIKSLTWWEALVDLAGKRTEYS